MAYAICNAVKDFLDVQFVIKVHPSELSLSVYDTVLKQVGIRALVTKEANIYEVLYVCDLMMTGYSTTALDAMILDKPVITLNLTGLKDPIPFAESGAAIGVYSEKDLKQAIKNALCDDSTKERLRRDRGKFVYEQTYLSDGKATERIVNLTEEMAANPRMKA
jgi:CDP-glycerol glycerophosphotransferase (TagB/SpsB family)